MRSIYRFAKFVNPKAGFFFSEIPSESGRGDSNLCALSSKFVAIVLKTRLNGRVGVFPLSKPGRTGSHCPSILGHSKQVISLQFSPHDDNLLVTASQDGSIATWIIPDEGILEDMTTPLASFKGHTKKITSMQFHPSAADVILTTSADKTLCVWNSRTGIQLACHGLPSVPSSAVWSWDGATIAVADNTHHISIVDSRSGDILRSAPSGCGGPKAPLLCRMGSTGRLACSGFSEASQRVLTVFNQDLEQVFEWGGSASSSVFMPFWSQPTGLLVLAAKKNNEVVAFETVGYPHAVSGHVSAFKGRLPKAAQGAALLPARGLDTSLAEIMVIFSASAGFVHPVSVRMDRPRGGAFASKFYQGGSLSQTAALSAQEYSSGRNSPPLVHPFDAAGRLAEAAPVKPVVVKTTPVKPVVVKTTPVKPVVTKTASPIEVISAQLDSITLSDQSCPSGHPLSLTLSSARVRCEVCHARHVAGSIIGGCKICRWRACLGCVLDM